MTKHRQLIRIQPFIGLMGFYPRSSPKIITDTDAVSPACKLGVVLDPIEAVRLMGILASAECVQRLSKATGKSE